MTDTTATTDTTAFDPISIAARLTRAVTDYASRQAQLRAELKSVMAALNAAVDAAVRDYDGDHIYHYAPLDKTKYELGLNIWQSVGNRVKITSPGSHSDVCLRAASIPGILRALEGSMHEIIDRINVDTQILYSKNH